MDTVDKSEMETIPVKDRVEFLHLQTGVWSFMRLNKIILHINIPSACPPHAQRARPRDTA